MLVFIRSAALKVHCIGRSLSSCCLLLSCYISKLGNLERGRWGGGGGGTVVPTTFIKGGLALPIFRKH